MEAESQGLRSGTRGTIMLLVAGVAGLTTCQDPGPRTSTRARSGEFGCADKCERPKHAMSVQAQRKVLGNGARV